MGAPGARRPGAYRLKTERREVVRDYSRKGILLLAVIAALAAVGCSKAGVKDESVATVNGEAIKVLELREFLGFRGPEMSAADVPAAKKKEALERLIAGRLFAQEGRARGLDNTEEYRNLVRQNEQGVLIAALFRKEIASKLKVPEGEVKAEAKKLRDADKTLSEDNASVQARRAVSEEKMKKIEEDLIAAAKKDVTVTVNEEAIAKIGKAGAMADDVVLATVGQVKVSYGDVKRLLQTMSGGQHGNQNLAANPVAVSRVLDREVTGKVLAAYARKSGIEGSEWMKSVRQDMERSVFIDLLAEKEILKGIQVTDKEIQAAYAEHASQFMRDGKKVPLGQVKEQLKAYLRNEKQKKALEGYIQELRKKANITIKEELLPKV